MLILHSAVSEAQFKPLCYARRMSGGYKDPRVAAYLKGGGPKEPIQRSHNGDALPPGWAVAAHSNTLYRTNNKGPRCYYINEEGKNVSWTRPRDTNKDYDKYKLSKRHVKLLGDDRPSLTAQYNKKALDTLEKSAALVRKRELSIAKTMRKIGPIVFITRLLFDEKSLFFDTWVKFTENSKIEKERMRQRMALKIQGRIRIKQAKQRVFEIKKKGYVEAHTTMKQLHCLISEYMGKMPKEDIKWFNEWTNGQRRSGFPGVITMSAKEKQLRKAKKQSEARMLVPKKKTRSRGNWNK